MSDKVREFLTEWHRIVAEKDLAALQGRLSEDVTMGAPPYWDKVTGRLTVHHLLGIIINTIDDFTYRREWIDCNELALEFTGHVGDRDLQGIDLITLDDDQRLVNLDVLIRPLNVLEELREIVTPQMIDFLSRLGDATD